MTTLVKPASSEQLAPAALPAVVPITDAVLLSWQRPANLPHIVARLLEQTRPRVRQVIVWNNKFCEAARLDRLLEPFAPRVTITHSRQNLYTLGRFLAADMSNADVILTCDDDALVSNWPQIFERHLETGRLVACLADGHYLRRDMYLHRIPGEDAGSPRGIAHEMLLGWGSAFRRETAENLFRFRQAIGQDLFQRKADRFFTMLQRRRHEVLRADFEHLPGATGGEALYRQPGHWALNREAVRVALQVLQQE